MDRNRKKLAYLAFAMHFITGVICMLVGSSMSLLVDFFQKPVEKVVLLGSAFSLGRTLTVYFVGKLTEKYDPLKILFGGVCGVLAFMLGTVLIPNYYLAFVCAFLGGIGMSCQDTISPLILSRVFTKNYSSSLSAGQSLYGLGGFAISFMIGVMLHANMPFSMANIILSLIGISMLVIIPSTKWEGEGETEEEKVKPIKLKDPRPAKAMMCVIIILYCCTCSTLASYMTTIMESLGNSQEVSAYVLSAYNLCALLGSLAFSFILRKVSESAVLAFNSISTLIVFAITVLVNKSAMYFVGMSITGFFTGVLFSIIVAIATRIDYEHISVAGAYISMFGGLGDIITPVITGSLVSAYGVTVVNKVVIVLLLMMTALSVVIYIITREEK